MSHPIANLLKNTPKWRLYLLLACALLIVSELMATEADAGYADAHAALGGAYRKTKNTTSAIRAYKAAIKINPKKGTWHYNLGILYQTKEDYKNAIPAYEAYLKLSPKARNAKSIRDIVVQMKDAIK